MSVSLTFAYILVTVLSVSIAHEACSRKLSRRVRSFLAEVRPLICVFIINNSQDVLSDSTIRSSALTQACPLAPWNDMYEDQEKQKAQQSNDN